MVAYVAKRHIYFITFALVRLSEKREKEEEKKEVYRREKI